MNSGFKLRWRMLSRDERMYSQGVGSVLVRRNEHEMVPCVLEFMTDGQTVADFWEPIPIVAAGAPIKLVPQRGVE